MTGSFAFIVRRVAFVLILPLLHQPDGEFMERGAPPLLFWGAHSSSPERQDEGG